MALYKFFISESIVKPLRKKYNLFALKTKSVARVDGRIILRWIFRKWDGRAWTGFIWLRIGTGGWIL